MRIRDEVRALGLTGVFAFEEDPDDFSLLENISLWSDMVDDLEKGNLWVRAELDVACAYRDDIDADLVRMPANDLRRRTVDFVDELDRRFLACVVFGRTLSSSYRGDPPSTSWWWNTIPRRTDQRLFLIGATGVGHALWERG